MTMTASPSTDNPQVLYILDELRKISNEVKTIDSELGTDTGGAVAQRNKLANGYVTQFAASEKDAEGNEQNAMQRFINQCIQQINQHFVSSDEEKVAIYTALTGRLDSEYGTKVKDFLQKQVDAQPKEEKPEVSDDRKQELAQRRSNLTEMFKLQTNMLKLLGFTDSLPSDIEVPTVRRGAVGKRVSFTKEYQFYVDGKLKQLTDADTGEKSNPKLSYIATTVCKDLNWKTKQLRDYIVEHTDATVSEDGSEITLPDEWEVQLPPQINKTLRGVAVTVTDSSAGVDDTEDDDDDDNGEDATPESNDFANL
jgi:hypothetical protein